MHSVHQYFAAANHLLRIAKAASEVPFCAGFRDMRDRVDSTGSMNALQSGHWNPLWRHSGPCERVLPTNRRTFVITLGLGEANALMTNRNGSAAAHRPYRKRRVKN